MFFRPLSLSLTYLDGGSINTFQVPGAEGNFVFIKDAVYKKPDAAILPFPTYFGSDDGDSNEPIVADLGEVDPFLVAE